MFSYEGISIRPVEFLDLEWLRDLRNEQSTWSNLGDIRMVSLIDQERWIKFIPSNSRYFIAVDSFEPDTLKKIGLVRCDEIDHFNRSIRIGADVDNSLRGLGYGTKIYNLMLKYCFDYLNMHRVWLAVLQTNQIAISLYNKVGFKEEGRYREAIYRDGRYIDYIIMSIIESEYKK